MAKSFFREQKNGYDKEQVENYIHKLMKAYQKAYADYLDTYDKYRALADGDYFCGRRKKTKKSI